MSETNNNEKFSETKITQIEKLKGIPIILFLNNGFRYECTITESSPMFITIKDIREITQLINVKLIDRIEIKGE